MKNISAKDFRLARCQATLFTFDEEISSARLIRELPEFMSFFDGEPTIIPSVEEFPKERPRIILRNNSDQWRCEISSARINLFRQIAINEEIIPPLEDIYTKAVELFSLYLRVMKVRIGRIAAVINRFLQHDSPGIYLARHFCKEKWNEAPLSRPEHFELHSHKKFDLNNKFLINSWVRNKTGSIAINNEIKPIILVIQDLNTLFENTGKYSYTVEDIRFFFELATKEAIKILQLYYPQEKNS